MTSLLTSFAVLLAGFLVCGKTTVTYRKRKEYDQATKKKANPKPDSRHSRSGQGNARAYTTTPFLPSPLGRPRPHNRLEVIPQTDLKAGCETYACTMLLKILGFDVDEHTIADNYLNIRYISWDENGNMFGPDMNSAFAGSPYSGWGVYAPSMAKSMNRYLADQKSELKAYNLKDVPFETLAESYTAKGIPVMVWATTDMQEPYVFNTWTVDYVDEDAQAAMGEKVSWYMHEHCLVLIGYDENLPIPAPAPSRILTRSW